MEIIRGGKVMRTRFGLTLTALSLLAGQAMAQAVGPMPVGPKPALRTDKTPTPPMPVQGRSSFTADQAKERMMKRGYNVTSNPLEDDKGIWYAEGEHDGKTVMVMMDYQGNVYEGSAYSGHPSSAPGMEPTNETPPKPVSPSQH
jgi:hypothetical protein